MNCQHTHIPLLVLLPILFPIYRVLECGSGTKSTPVFCSREIYPDMRRFDSLENGPQEYANAVRTAVGSVDRNVCYFHYSHLPMAKMASHFALDCYDLILIDDSTEIPDRVANIRSITSAASHPVIVIHDFEHQPYRDAVAPGWNKIIFDEFLPHVALLWHEIPFPISYLDILKPLIQQFFHRTILLPSILGPDYLA